MVTASSGDDSVLFRRLKRALEDTSEDTNVKETYLQPISLSAENLLLVFTDKSLRQADGDESTAYCDNERIALLGEKVLDACVDEILFLGDMGLAAEEIINHRKSLLSEQNLHGWAATLIPKLRYHPEAASTLGSIAVRQRLFNAYVGAIYLDHDLEIVRDWLYTLLTPQLGILRMPPLKKLRNEPSLTSPPEGEPANTTSQSSSPQVTTGPSVLAVAVNAQGSRIQPEAQPTRTDKQTLVSAQGQLEIPFQPSSPFPSQKSNSQSNLPNPLSPAQPGLPVPASFSSNRE